MKRNEIIKYLKMFFPAEGYCEENFDSCYERDELDTHKGSIENILKGALLDDMILEVQINSREEIFHCRLLGKRHKQKSGKRKTRKALRLEEYSKADYISSHSEIFITPLDPSIGNIILFKSTEDKTRVLLRIIEQDSAIELACFFVQRLTVNNLPALQLTYPFLIRRISSAREYRAKIPSSMKFKVVVSKRNNKQFSTLAVNISHNGLAFLDPAPEKSTLVKGEEIQLELQVPRVTNFLINASIAHITKLRRDHETQRIVGVQFLNTFRYKEKIEFLVAAVTEAHSRERDGIANDYGIFYDDW